MDWGPLVLFSFSLINFFQLIDANLRIERARCNDGSELGPGPFDLPGWGSLNTDNPLLIPLFRFFNINFDGFVTAGSSYPPASPVEAEVVDDDAGR